MYRPWVEEVPATALILVYYLLHKWLRSFTARVHLNLRPKEIGTKLFFYYACINIDHISFLNRLMLFFL